MKKTKKNYYAIRLINEKKNIVVKKWSECQQITKGHNNMFKGFMTEEEACEWLKEITPKQEKKHDEMVKQQREVKKLKKDRVLYQFRIDQKLSDDLQKKMAEMHLTVDRLMDDLIRDYLYGED